MRKIVVSIMLSNTQGHFPSIHFSLCVVELGHVAQNCPKNLIVFVIKGVCFFLYDLRAVISNVSSYQWSSLAPALENGA